MSESNDSASVESSAGAEAQMEASAYEIIRARLGTHAKDLRERLELLNSARKDVFGSIETSLIGTERVTTDNNCVARDMLAIGDKFIFGYNVRFGLRTETNISDVFGVFSYKDHAFHPEPLEILEDENFHRDFKEVYRYYKSAVFAKFFEHAGAIYMVFQVGKDATDTKTLKWHLDGDRLVYADNRSDHEVQFPSQHDFQWLRTTRDQHRYGLHPHISINDRIFVETVGGDLTIKVENNTESGRGIYEEDVENHDQTLDDAQIYYAIVGNNILLKIRPYQEQDFRYIIYNEKLQRAQRLDAIEHACIQLPDDHGLIFPNGYYLQSGESKTFGDETERMMFERQIAAPNGEDYLYVFCNRATNMHVLLHYNLIEQQVEPPLICHGFSLFQNGEMLCFKSNDEPQKHHAVQIWRTPYVDADHVPHANTDSYLFKVGNRDIVRGMAECHEVLNLIDKDESYADLYVDLTRKSGDIVDSYYWVAAEDACNLSAPLKSIRETASAAIDEYEKVTRVRQSTAEATREVTNRAEEALGAAIRRQMATIDEFVQTLAELRRVRGEAISLKELRYADIPTIDALEKKIAEAADRTGQRCVQFLLRDDALAPYAERVSQQAGRIELLKTVVEAKSLEEEIANGANELEMLIEIVSNLKIEDATHRTAIIDNISALFGKINQSRASLKNRIKDLMSVEGRAEFSSQMKLLNQGVVNYLDICDSPQKCDEFLTKVMVQIEELEGRFAEFDEFVEQLVDKREEAYNAFETRKLSLVEARNRRASSLASAADRILKGIKSRVDHMESANDIHGYFAADLMIDKVRDIVAQLTELDDTVKVDDIQSRLKTIREDAVRQLKDRQELFVDGQNIIQFGSHKFTVNVQQLDLTTVLRDDRLCLHLTGTNFFETITDDGVNALRDAWQQEVVSENKHVYRGEYLAYQMLTASLRGELPQSLDVLKRMPVEELQTAVQQFMAPRYNEAYSKGVHDHDAALILHRLLEMRSSIGLLRHPAAARAMANLYWTHFCNERSSLAARLRGAGRVELQFPQSDVRAGYVQQLCERLNQFADSLALFPADLASAAAEYAYDELSQRDLFVVSRRAATLWEDFHREMRNAGKTALLADSLRELSDDPAARFQLSRDWASAFVRAQVKTGDDPSGSSDDLDFVDEVALLLMEEEPLAPQRLIDGQVSADIEGVVGSHTTIQKGRYHLHYTRFLEKLQRYEQADAAKFRDFLHLKRDFVDAARREMRLSEFQPRVLTSFVRNRLIDEVYLPLVGDNLAKQMGTAGEQKRTDRMGLLLLVSPPGYGKTTLMEYIANRLGLIFMKINGPAIGHHVTSLDPAEAPNAGAREEIVKLNLALEMGDNVMLYVDDIQHCNPEFLQKFISLCDAQRKIEGVYKGDTKTYDLRGRKVAVVMAGNPYTESGEKFQIPDMLSNRADIYNLGEIIGESADAFELSYLENALTSNPALNKIASRSHNDIHPLVQIAEHGSTQLEFEASYSLEETQEMVQVLKKLLRVRDVVLRVNREYIRSAAQSDDYRTEPPFKLQGSYRNMNRIAEKVAPIMNDAELEALILANYENDAQTLTSDTESNLLKLKQMLGSMTLEEETRWNEITRTYAQNVKLQGVGSDDPMGRVLVQLGTVGENLHAVRSAIAEGVAHLVDAQSERAADTDAIADQKAAKLVEELAALRQGLTQIAESATHAAVTPESSQAPPLPPIPAEAFSKGGGLHKVTVQHKVPRSILAVVESQFKLMSEWVEPLNRLVAEQGQQQSTIQQTLNECLDKYESLIHELSEAQDSKSRSSKNKKRPSN